HPQSREAPRGPERPDRGAGHDVLFVLLRPSRSRRTHRGGVRAIGAQLARTPGPPVRWTRVTCHTLEQTALSKRRSRGRSPELLPLTVGRSMYDRRAVLTPRGVLAIEMKAERRVTLVLCLMMVAAVLAGPAAATASGLGSSPTPEKTVFQKAGIVLPHGAPGEADSVYARAPFVLRDDDGTYKMWYSGYDGSVNRMLYASSPDGIRWTKHGVILDVGVPPYNWNSVGGQSVLKIQSVYHMWFSAGYWSGGRLVFLVLIYQQLSMHGFCWTVAEVVVRPAYMFGACMTDSAYQRRSTAMSIVGLHSSNSPCKPVGGPDPAPAFASRVLLFPDWLADPSGPRLYYVGGDGSTLQIGLIKNTTVKDEVPVPLTLDDTPRIAALGTVAAIDAAVVGLALFVGRRPPRRPSAPPPQEWPRIQPPGPS